MSIMSINPFAKARQIFLEHRSVFTGHSGQEARCGQARSGMLIEIMNDVGLSKKEFLELLER